MTTQSSTENPISYNGLRSIAEASRVLNERGGDEVVSKLLSIIVESGFGDKLGIRLLHKHADIGAKEMMLERGVVDDDGFALITGPVASGGHSRAVCNSWRLLAGEFVPLEFSQAELIFDRISPQTSGAVFSQLADEIAALGVEDLLGPSVNYSDSVDRRAPSENVAFLEKTDGEDRQNVFRYVSRDDIAFQGSAKTKWHAKQTLDESGKLIWVTACNCFCSAFPEGEHQGIKTRRFS
jgi:hypothetical protein